MQTTATIRVGAVALAAATVEGGLAHALRASVLDLAATGASPDGRVAALLSAATTGAGLLGWTAWCGVLLVAWCRARRCWPAGSGGPWLRLAAVTLGVATGLTVTAPTLAAERPSAGCEPDRIRAALAGLPLPTLPTAGTAGPSARPEPSYLVRRGDSLWSIAGSRWRHWYAANREVVGPDPDLLLPGQRLRPPPPPPAAGKADR